MIKQVSWEIGFTELLKSSIHATDGRIGTLKDIYFDDTSWRVRYLVVDTGRWLPGRKVLLTPHSLDLQEPTGKSLTVNLSRQQVHDSPPIDSDKPVSRQQEAKLGAYYGWPPIPPAPLIGGGMLAAGYTYTGAHYAHTEMPVPVTPEDSAEYDPHLRSAKEVTGYVVTGRDRDIGSADELLIDLEHAVITAIVVAVEDNSGAGQLRVPAHAVSEIRWDARRLVLGDER